MAHPWHHAQSSARRFGGVPDDYLAVHGWFDQTKGHWADARHRAVLHSSFGIFLCEQFFGPTLKRASDGKHVPTRLLGEQHVLEDLGRIPTVQDWLEGLPLQGWMLRNAAALSREKAEAEGEEAPLAPSPTDSGA